jgi:hypothetical protein
MSRLKARVQSVAAAMLAASDEWNRGQGGMRSEANHPEDQRATDCTPAGGMRASFDRFCWAAGGRIDGQIRENAFSQVFIMIAFAMTRNADLWGVLAKKST